LRRNCEVFLAQVPTQLQEEGQVPTQVLTQMQVLGQVPTQV
jgi:hypothetical protein